MYWRNTVNIMCESNLPGLFFFAVHEVCIESHALPEWVLCNLWREARAGGGTAKGTCTLHFGIHCKLRCEGCSSTHMLQTTNLSSGYSFLHVEIFFTFSHLNMHACRVSNLVTWSIKKVCKNISVFGQSWLKCGTQRCYCYVCTKSWRYTPDLNPINLTLCLLFKGICLLIWSCIHGYRINESSCATWIFILHTFLEITNHYNFCFTYSVCATFVLPSSLVFVPGSCVCLLSRRLV